MIGGCIYSRGIFPRRRDLFFSGPGVWIQDEEGVYWMDLGFTRLLLRCADLCGIKESGGALLAVV